SALYKAMDMDFDLRVFMDDYKEIGRVDYVGSFGKMDSMKFDMDYIVQAENGSALKSSMMKWFKHAETKKVMTFSEINDSFNDNKIYRLESKNQANENIPDMENFVLLSDSGIFLSSTVKKLKEISAKKITTSSEEGFALMKIDLSAMGLPMKNIVKVLFTGALNGIDLKVTF
ncbi:MAG: hypothetical protein NE327_19260, partial [Lentisphaeraceae bacterium]|nr:hypothetical protein [Lentisphaeraceae bacterium]